MKHSILQKIRQARLRQKFSQQYMADRLNMTQGYYNKLENGKKKLTLDVIIQIAVILNLEITEFFGPENNNKSA